MSSNQKQWLAVIALVVVAVVGILFTWNRYERSKSADSDKPAQHKIVDVGQHTSAKQPVSEAPSQEQLRGHYERGVQLMEQGKLIAARDEISKVLISGTPGEKLAEKARAALTELADKTLFSPVVYQNDPHTFSYTFRKGDVLVKVERQLGLHVPTQIVLRINGIGDPTTIRAGETLKMIRGPFHAVVRKSKFVMDVYLNGLFVRRFRVGLGAPETPTPAGHFRVKLGGKLLDAPYTPPPSTGLEQRAILPGHPEYPLDMGGHWISLTGIPEKGTNYTHEDGYGIHGTNDPDSVGKPSSHGCIRLTDQDIVTAFSLLYEKWSTVTIEE